MVRDLYLQLDWKVIRQSTCWANSEFFQINVSTLPDTQQILSFYFSPPQDDTLIWLSSNTKEGSRKKTFRFNVIESDMLLIIQEL